jgi:hypothetical protein
MSTELTGASEFLFHWKFVALVEEFGTLWNSLEFDAGGHPLHHPYKRDSDFFRVPFFLAWDARNARISLLRRPVRPPQLQLHKRGRKFSFGNKNTKETPETKYCI